jgi:hypothetical protein
LLGSIAVFENLSSIAPELDGKNRLLGLVCYDSSLEAEKDLQNSIRFADKDNSKSGFAVQGSVAGDS